MRSGEFILPRSADFWQALKDRREAFAPAKSKEGAQA
jgi:hypothetical protein